MPQSMTINIDHLQHGVGGDTTAIVPVPAIHEEFKIKKDVDHVHSFFMQAIHGGQDTFERAWLGNEAASPLGITPGRSSCPESPRRLP